MTTYLPGSLTEIIIAHGAEGLPLDPELVEIGQIIVSDPTKRAYEDPAVDEYMALGVELVRAVITRER